MLKNNCRNCKHFQFHWGSNPPEGFVAIADDYDGTLYGKCAAGNDSVMIDWWNKNKDKLIDDLDVTLCACPEDLDNGVRRLAGILKSITTAGNSVNEED